MGTVKVDLLSKQWLSLPGSPVPMPFQSQKLHHFNYWYWLLWLNIKLQSLGRGTNTTVLKSEPQNHLHNSSINHNLPTQPNWYITIEDSPRIYSGKRQPSLGEWDVWVLFGKDIGPAMKEASLPKGVSKNPSLLCPGIPSFLSPPPLATEENSTSKGLSAILYRRAGRPPPGLKHEEKGGEHSFCETAGAGQQLERLGGQASTFNSFICLNRDTRFSCGVERDRDRERPSKQTKT